MLGQPGTHLAWDHPSPSVMSLSEDEDASAQATTYLLTAQGSTDADGNQHPLCARADNPELLDAAFPALWRVNSSGHSSVVEQDTLDAYARAYAAAHRDPVVLRPFTVYADDSHHPLGSYKPGDTVLLTVHDDPWIPRGNDRVQRITDVAVDETTVQLTVAEYTA